MPYAAGSGTDTVARFVQPQLSAELGQQIIVDNRPGAGGNIGAELASRAPADGYTVMLANISNAISMSLYSRPGYDLIKDFAPIMLVASGSFTLATHPSLPVKSVKELIALARKRPGSINVATAGPGIQVAAKLFDSMTGISTTEINYRSTPQSITAVISGEASFGFPATTSAIPHAKSGKLRALAVTSSRRASMAPDVPTVAESGVPGYEVAPWYGLMAPGRTSKEIIARLHTAMANALKHPEVKMRFGTTDIEPIGSTPEQLDAYVRIEVEKWAKIVKAYGIRPD